MNLKNLEEEFPHNWEDESRERDSLNPRKEYYNSKYKRENPPRKDEFAFIDNDRVYK